MHAHSQTGPTLLPTVHSFAMWDSQTVRNPGAVTCCFGLAVTPARTLWRTQCCLRSFLVVTRSLAEPYFFNTIFGNGEVWFGLNRKRPPGSHVWSLVGGAVMGGGRAFAMGPPGRWKSVEVEGEVYSFRLSWDVSKSRLHDHHRWELGSRLCLPHSDYFPWIMNPNKSFFKLFLSCI